jgi:hypothetical protein
MAALICPECSKSNFHDYGGLLQHLMSKHADSPSAVRLRGHYSYPRICDDCPAKIESAIAHVTHCAALHHTTLARLVGLALAANVGTEPSIAGMAPIYELADSDETSLEVVRPLAQASRICYFPNAVMRSITLIAPTGIATFSLANAAIGAIQRLLWPIPFVIFGDISAQDVILATNFGDSKIMFSAGVFATDKLITWVLGHETDCLARLLHGYLAHIGFFEDVPHFACCICLREFPTRVDVYRELYRAHSPFPAFIINRMKLPNTAFKSFVCIACREQCSSYDNLIIHVFEAHRRDLLEETQRDVKLAGEQQAPALEAWVDAEIAQLVKEEELADSQS